MKPTIENDDDPIWANIRFNVKLFTKRGLKIVIVGGAFGLIAAWLLAGWQALTVWGCYRYDSGAGWIIIWIIVSAIILGVFFGIDGTKGGK